MKIEIALVRRFIEDGCGDADYVLWCLGMYEADEHYFDVGDDNCFTLPNGECIGTEECMHSPKTTV